MTLDAKYVVTSDVDTYFVNKDTGQALSNGQLIFYRDSARNVPKAVFELSGAPPNYTYTSMGAVVQLSNSGTVMDSQGANQVIYYYPYITDVSSGKEVLDLYYVVCEDANGVVQFTREAWPNIADSSVSPSQEDAPLNNQISNPTFTNVFVNDIVPTTISVSAAVSQVVPIGPDWDLVLSGTGSVAVQRVAVSGFESVVSNPPYVLDILVNSGITTCLLRQRMKINSGLWSSSTNELVYLTGSFVAENIGPGTVNVKMYYAQSGGALASAPVLIVDGTVTGSYSLIQGGTISSIPASSDNNKGDLGFVDIYLSLVVNTHIRVSSIQLVPSFSAAETVPYNLDSSNRSEAYQGDYYIPNLNAKPLSSYLVGWDFQVNPFQFGRAGGVLQPNPIYIADQTILYGNFSGVGTERWDLDALHSLQLSFLTASPPTQSMYLLQYLTGDIVKKMLGTPLSVNVNSYQFSGTPPIKMRVYLFRSPAASPIPAGTFPNPASIGTIAADGTFTLTASGWTAIPRSGLDTPVVNLNVTSDINHPDNDIGFSQWKITDSAQINDTSNFAIVVTFSAGGVAVVKVNSISVVPGNIPCRPAIQSSDEVLRQCQYYYNKSFLPGDTPANSVPNGPSYAIQFDPPSTGAIGPIIRFSSPMRSTPNVLLYNPRNSNSQICAPDNLSDWSSSAPSKITANGFETSGITPASSAAGVISAVHWSADARLGLY